MRSIVCLIVSVFVCSACTLDRSAIAAPSYFTDAGVTWPDAAEVRPDAVCPQPDDTSPAAEEPVWPRSRPAGTLLVDQERHLWMTGDHGTRLQVSGDDSLGLVSLDEGDAIPMTREEERCLIPLEDYWTAPNGTWWPVYGPEEDPYIYIVDSAARMRYPISEAALKSYGYYVDWIDEYDDRSIPWSELELGPVIGIRDGSLVHTEYGFAYVVNDRSFYFRPYDLVAAAGYHLEDAIWITDQRLREIAPPSVSMEYDMFDDCPADHL